VKLASHPILIGVVIGSGFGICFIVIGLLFPSAFGNHENITRFIFYTCGMYFMVAYFYWPYRKRRAFWPTLVGLVVFHVFYVTLIARHAPSLVPRIYLYAIPVDAVLAVLTLNRILNAFKDA
jgi:hypothetical protein